MRPPALKDGEATKTFIVVPGYIITDNDGVRRIGIGTLPAKPDVEGNNLIELSFAQATFYKKMGAIDVPLEDFSNDVPATPTGDLPQTSAGSEADGNGKPDVGSASKDPFA